MTSESSSLSDAHRRGSFNSSSGSTDRVEEESDNENDSKENKANEPPKKGYGKEARVEEEGNNNPDNSPSESRGNENKENEPPRKGASKRRAKPPYSDGKVGKHSLMRHFPRRASFRRMKTWAGGRIDPDVIRLDELVQLKDHPSFERPMRRNNIVRMSIPPTMNTTTEPATTATSRSQKSKQRTQSKKKTKTAAQERAIQHPRQDSAATKPARRNPTRAARLRK